MKITSHYAPIALHYDGFLVVQQPVAFGLTTVMLRSYVATLAFGL
jgi:hypothetical protein